MTLARQRFLALGQREPAFVYSSFQVSTFTKSARSFSGALGSGGSGSGSGGSYSGDVGGLPVLLGPQSPLSAAYQVLLRIPSRTRTIP